MITQTDEVQPRRFKDTQDLLEGHLAVVGVFGMAVKDPTIIVQAGNPRNGLALCAEGLPRCLLAREQDEPVVQRAA